MRLRSVLIVLALVVSLVAVGALALWATDGPEDPPPVVDDDPRWAPGP